MEQNALEARKKQLEEELKEINEEEKKAIIQLNTKKRFPPNAIPINKITVKRLIREIQKKHDEKANEIELWARGRMIQKAFYIACCDSMKNLYVYKETKSSLDKVENRERKGEMFDIATVKIIMKRLEKKDEKQTTMP